MNGLVLSIEMSLPGGLTFEEIVRQRETQILRVAYRILGNWADAEDIAQEALVRLHKHGLAFSNETAMATWLHRVTVNLSIDRIRSPRNRNAQLFDFVAAAGPSPEDVALEDRRKLLLTAALSELPPRERAAIVLREIEGLSTADVARTMGSTETTVRSQISKGMTRLREILSATLGQARNRS